MPSKARLKKIQKNVKRALKSLNFGASKPGVRGGPGPPGPPVDPHLNLYIAMSNER